MQYVIHYHETSQSHYDFMIERKGYLETFRVGERDMQRLMGGIIVDSVKINDHRLDYLSYEGPVSCDRGCVRLFDSGEYAEKGSSDSSFILLLNGTVFHGLILFLRIKGNSYSMHYDLG